MTRLALVLILLAFPAWGQTCTQRQTVVDFLAMKYEETVRVRALTSTGTVMETLASDGGSWSLIVTHPNGCSSVVLVGEGFTLMPVTPQKAGYAL